ncbi:hypothetical protein [Kitasatospora sp. NPDC096140]|uniref:hypothetical protein n=1 Tax=Kitasatospora sp. NPDC096140 TaxID=3155425 RepID=UPI003332E2A7
MSEQGQEQPAEQGTGEVRDQSRNQGQGQDQSGNQDPTRDGEPQQKPAAKARLVFRDPLDQQSRDDTDTGWGERSGAGESGGRGLDWYLSQRPPHHGG